MPSPPQTLLTDRLNLTVLGPGDALAYRHAIDSNDAHLRPWIPFMAKEPRSLEDTKVQMEGILEAFKTEADFRYAIRLQGEDEIIGEAMLLTRAGPGRLEIGYWLSASYGGRGYCGEAVGALIQEAFKLPGIDGVIGVCDVENGPSNRVMERRGGHISEVKSEVDWNNQPVSLNVWLIKAPKA